MNKPNKFLLLLITLIHFCPIQGTSKESSEMTLEELNQELSFAVKSRNAPKVQELIDAGADVHTPVYYTYSTRNDGDCDWGEVSCSAITYAVIHNDPEILKILIKEEDHLNPFLDLAINEGYFRIVEELINSGVNINHIDMNGNTPLINAIINAHPAGKSSPDRSVVYKSNQRQKIIDLLLEAGANITPANNNGRTALMEAVIKHDLDTVQALLIHPEMEAASGSSSYTSPLNAADNEGNTALILAIKGMQYSYYSGNIQQYNICETSQEIFVLLIENPVIDIFHENNQGESALELIQTLIRDFVN